jgi:hypothetical protein
MATKKWMEENKDKMREYRKKYYHANKTSEKARIAKRKKELWLWFDEYKQTLKCDRCPESHTGCLDFHHLDSKEKELSICKAVGNGWSIERIMKEVEKCIVLCSNCHRKLHYDAKKK